MRGTILIIGNKSDPHIQTVSDFLRKAEAEFFILDPALSLLEKPTLLTYKFGDEIEVLFGQEGRKPSVTNIATVWWRLKPAFERSERTENLDSTSRNFIVREWQHTLEGLEDLFSHAFWMNPRSIDRHVRHKPSQLLAANKVGFSIPRTLISNDAKTIEAFISESGGDCLYKPLTWFFKPPDKLLFANRINLATISSNHQSIELAPGIFQRYVPKLYELRVTVVGDEIFCLKIHSQEREDTLTDWRKNQKQVKYTVERLPDEIERRLILLHRSLGLVFGAYDFIVTPEHQYVFLEVNPVGQWLWLEESTEVGISHSVSRLLIERSIPPAHATPG